MVRTKDTANVKAAGAKATRKLPPGSQGNSSLSDSAKKKYSGGNPYFPRETPSWQKPITKFFGKADGEASACSTSTSCASVPAPSDLKEELNTNVDMEHDNNSDGFEEIIASQTTNGKDMDAEQDTCVGISNGQHEENKAVENSNGLGKGEDKAVENSNGLGKGEDTAVENSNGQLEEKDIFAESSNGQHEEEKPSAEINNEQNEDDDSDVACSQI